MEYARVHSIPLRSKFISCFSSDLLLLQLSLASHCIASMPSHSCILNHHRHRSLPLPLPLHLSRRKRLSLPPTPSLIYSPSSRFDCATLEVLSFSLSLLWSHCLYNTIPWFVWFNNLFIVRFLLCSYIRRLFRRMNAAFHAMLLLREPSTMFVLASLKINFILFFCSFTVALLLLFVIVLVTQWKCLMLWKSESVISWSLILSFRDYYFRYLKKQLYEWWMLIYYFNYVENLVLLMLRLPVETVIMRII